ncbi:NAD/NADP octopine/nopaline dehydrogenase family protein [Roseomonas sp. OT10]|uniref:NAD/NADP-dependent octopine/nopaline dehydrogenase family protein n=1 Tax=Roseomonas cutis TaxID=2897332 RepID=UPI001E3D3718|nr:NAD/NADP-dependent octopine/nopaline dehydrogenase family protein [Roseomonas sp. OT10]UFN47890.1 NAD/NADP octopine/nopaline dehydrogenase family protein [Roseomonas sp. OT10]
MRVGILGAGAVAYGSAAFLCANGHEARLWSPSGRRTEALAAGAPLVSEGVVAGEFHPVIAGSCAAALDGADVALVALPANGYRMVLEAMAPHLRPGQVVIVSAHASFGALYLSRLLAARGLELPIVALSTTVLRARQTSPTRVRVATLRGKVDMATVPAAAAAEGLAACNALFGERFLPRADLLAVALSNVNPQSHLALALCNFTRMEKGEAWGQSEHMTESVGRLLEAVDAERLAIAAAFGREVRSMRQHYSLTYGLPDAPVAESARILAARDAPTLGPATIQTRYTLEDVPFGLVPLAWLGRLAGVPVPLHEAGIALFSALYGRDLAAENDLLPALEAQGLAEEILAERGIGRSPAAAGN